MVGYFRRRHPVARRIDRTAIVLATPYVALSAIAALGAIVGSHPHSYVVAAALLLHGLLVYKGSATLRQTAPSAGTDATARLITRRQEQWDLLGLREDIVRMHQLAEAQAKKSNGAPYYEKTYAAAWEVFRDNPTRDNAQTLLNAAPPLRRMFDARLLQRDV